MFLLNKFKKRKPVVSFEIFPPNQHMTLKRLLEVIDGLAIYRPDFISVTYGASGNASNNYTIDIAQYIKEKYTIEAMPHLTCINTTLDKMETLLSDIVQKDLKNILALRGDLPKSQELSTNLHKDFTYASDLITYVKDQALPISTAAACYPEGHVESSCLDQDLNHLKYKVACGVDFLITQLFFDNDKFYSFKNKLFHKDIHVPVTVGIMPITNAKQIKRIVQLSGASIPKDLQNILTKYEYDEKSMFEAGIEFASYQIENLMSYNVDGFHLYVMNKPSVAKSIYKNMGW